jgi:hypothetical protein
MPQSGKQQHLEMYIKKHRAAAVTIFWNNLFERANIIVAFTLRIKLERL